jgi:hypothetical protein
MLFPVSFSRMEVKSEEHLEKTFLATAMCYFLTSMLMFRSIIRSMP